MTFLNTQKAQLGKISPYFRIGLVMGMTQTCFPIFVVKKITEKKAAKITEKVQEYLKDAIPAFWNKDQWPPNSSDLNPMDYSIWGIAALRLGKTASSDVMANLPPQTVASTCARFLPKCKAVVEKNGGFIE